jgi:hypothetical protein
MAKRLIILVVALFALGFVVTGCGDDEKTDTVDVTDTDTVTDDETVTDTVTDETVTDETVTEQGGGAAAPSNVEEAVEACKDAVTRYPNLSSDTKSDLESFCDKAADSPEDAREAGREVCKKIIEDMYPSGAPGKDTALSACENSGN